MRRSTKKLQERDGRGQRAPKIEPRLPRALFSTGFDDVATRWHKKADPSKDLLPLVRQQLAIEALRVSEALIIAPKVSLKVFGENVVICRLIDTYGVAGVERLLEEDAIEFVLWRGQVLNWEKPRPGLFPLVPFTMTNPEHSDPQISVEAGLKGWSRQPWPEVERLARLAAARTIIPAQALPKRAIDAVYAAYRAGALAQDGHDATVPLETMPPNGREELALLADRVHEGLLLFESEYDLHEAADSWEALLKVSSTLRAEDPTVRTIEQVLALEGLPSIPELLLNDVVNFTDVLNLRSHPATAEFREWLWSQPDPRDTKAVARAYLGAITGKKLLDRSWFKTARVTAINAVQGLVGAGIGASVAGMPGLIAGGVVGLGMSLADTFGLESLLRGVSPRRFAEEVIRPRVAQKLVDGTPQRNRKQRRQEAATRRTR